MKQYDVFISYSRRDIDEANLLCAELDAAGVKYWIDRNIHGSANFLTEITARIRECKVLLFIASQDSANSEWTQKEILYAIKNHKVIVPYRIGEFSFDANPELDFVFMNVQWLENRAEVVRDACELCGIEPPKSDTATPYSDLEEQARLKAERNAEIEARLAKEREEFNCKVAEWERQAKLREEQERREREKKEQTTPQRNTSTKQNAGRSGRLKRLAIILALMCAIGYGVNIYKQQAAEKAEEERIAQEQRATEAKAEEERIAQEQRIEQERVNKARIAEQKRLAAEKAEAERIAEERANKERIAEEQRIAEAKAEKERCALSGKGNNGVYEVGYYYDNGVVKGIVFEVSNGGKHGKIVGLQQSYGPWCKDGRELEVTLGASNKKDGKANTNIVKNRNNWKKLYPGHGWCTQFGEDWYMPAESELYKIYLSLSTINDMMSKKGGTLINERGQYWSSTEYDNRYAMRVLMSNGSALHISKSMAHGVYMRAVATF